MISYKIRYILRSKSLLNILGKLDIILDKHLLNQTKKTCKLEKNYKLSVVACTLLNPPTWRQNFGTGSVPVGSNCPSKCLVDCVTTCNLAPVQKPEPDRQ